VWEHLLPAMFAGALPEDPAATERLQTKLASLSLPVQSGEATSPMSGEISGQKYRLGKNAQGIVSAGVDLTSEKPVIALSDGDGDHAIACGFGSWVSGRTAFKKSISALLDRGQQGVAASCGWIEEGVLAVRLYFTETPYSLELRLAFRKRRVDLDVEHHIRWGDEREKRVTGVR
jgi:hypothetical protein